MVLNDSSSTQIQNPPHLVEQDLPTLSDYRVLNFSSLREGDFVIDCLNDWHNCRLYYLNSDVKTEGKPALYLKEKIQEGTQGQPVDMKNQSDSYYVEKLFESNSHLIFVLRPRDLNLKYTGVVIQNIHDVLDRKVHNFTTVFPPIENIICDSYKVFIQLKTESSFLYMQSYTRKPEYDDPKAPSTFDLSKYNISGPIRAILSSSSIFEVLVGNTLWIIDLRADKVLGGAIHKDLSTSNSSCKLKRVAGNMLAAYCEADRAIVFFDIKNTTSPSSVDSLKINISDTTSMFIGFRYIYTTTSAIDQNPASYRLIIYDILSPNNFIRYDQNLPLRASYSKATILSSFSSNDNETFFSLGGNSDISQVSSTQKVSIIISPTKGFDHEKYFRYNEVRLPGCYQFTYSMMLSPYCDAKSQAQNYTMSILIFYPIYPIKPLSSEKVQSSSKIYPGDLFSGPILKLKLVEASSNYNATYPKNLTTDSELYPPMKFALPFIAVTPYQNKLYVLKGYDAKTLQVEVIDLDSSSQGQSSIFNISESDLDRVKIASCRILPLECESSNISFVLDCQKTATTDTRMLNGYYSLNSSEKAKSRVKFEHIVPERPLKNRPGENLFFVEANPSSLSTGDSTFLKGIFLDLGQAGAIKNKIDIEVNYSSIVTVDGEKFSTTGILSYDIWPQKFTQEAPYSHVAVALTKDNKLIVSFMGDSKISFSKAWNLEDTSIFKVDQTTTSYPSFTEVRWAETNCNPSASNPSMQFVLESSNFYSYVIKIIIDSSGVKSHKLSIAHSYAYYPGYPAIDSAYDYCSNVFVAIAKAKGTSKCALLTYPGNSLNASVFRIGNNPYETIEVISVSDVECPSSKHTNQDSTFFYLTGSTLDNATVSYISEQSSLYTRTVRSYYSLPSPIKENGDIELKLEASNGVFSAVIAVRSSSKVPEKPSSTFWIWASVLLACVVVIAILIVVIRKRTQENGGYHSAGDLNHADIQTEITLKSLRASKVKLSDSDEDDDKIKIN